MRFEIVFIQTFQSSLKVLYHHITEVWCTFTFTWRNSIIQAWEMKILKCWINLSSICTWPVSHNYIESTSTLSLATIYICDELHTPATMDYLLSCLTHILLHVNQAAPHKKTASARAQIILTLPHICLLQYATMHAFLVQPEEHTLKPSCALRVSYTRNKRQLHCLSALGNIGSHQSY